jgi:hypothetical protein
MTLSHNIATSVEIKCRLDATGEFLLQILLLAQHVSGTIKPIIRSSRVLYNWLLLFVFGAWFPSCWYSVELRVVCLVCRLQPADQLDKNTLFMKESSKVTSIKRQEQRKTRQHYDEKMEK